jgi:phage tail protein X
MSGTVITKGGDVVDLLALAAYGYTAGATEAILAANPGLAAAGPVLDAGLTVVLPDIADPQQALQVQLWD